MSDAIHFLLKGRIILIAAFSSDGDIRAGSVYSLFRPASIGGGAWSVQYLKPGGILLALAPLGTNSQSKVQTIASNGDQPLVES